MKKTNLEKIGIQFSHGTGLIPTHNHDGRYQMNWVVAGDQLYVTSPRGGYRKAMPHHNPPKAVEEFLASHGLLATR